MLNTKRICLLSLVLLPLIAITQPAPALAQANATPPCWLEAPAANGPNGQIGISRTITAGKYKPLEISQLRAIDALCHARNEASCSDAMIQTALEQKQLFGQPLHFAQYEQEGYLYSYASFTPVEEKSCQLSQCDISACSPAWLCQPSSANNNGLLGVSYQATSAFNQYKAAIENGLLQAAYLYGVEISASKHLRSVTSGISSYRFLSEASDIDDGGQEKVPYYLANQCRSQSTLYTRIILNRPGNENPTANTGNTDWIRNPKLDGIDGAVGAVEYMVASGLLSDQIELAIERAAVQLAFEKYSHVSEQGVQIVRSNGGIFRISSITENTRVELKARVLKIHFDQQPGSHTKVYVWLAAIG